MTMVAAAREERIESSKGVKIFVRSWMPAIPPRAVVLDR